MNDAPISLYDIDCIDLAGKPLSLRQYVGRPLLIVNTASLCGFSHQFIGLESVWHKYKNKGLVVLGVPSNDFGHQEPGDSAQIVSLCLTKFAVTFPMLVKTPVSGVGAHPLFRLLAAEGGFWSKPRWNFYKYLIGKDGHLTNWFSTVTDPTSSRFEEALRKVIG